MVVVCFVVWCSFFCLQIHTSTSLFCLSFVWEFTWIYFQQELSIQRYQSDFSLHILCQRHHRGTLETWMVKAFGRHTRLKCQPLPSFSWNCSNFQVLCEFPVEQLICFFFKSVFRAYRYSLISRLVQACCEKIPQRWPGRQGEAQSKGGGGKEQLWEECLWAERALGLSSSLMHCQYLQCLPWPLLFVFPCWDGFYGSLICLARLWGMRERYQS